jgi:hypothetical protein
LGWPDVLTVQVRGRCAEQLGVGRPDLYVDGKAANFEPLDGDPLDLGDVEAAAEEFRAAILRLAPDPEAS